MPTASDPERRQDLAALAAVTIVTALVFATTLRNGFVATWDDDLLVLANEQLRGLSLATLGWALTTYHAHVWAPLTWLSLALDRALWGLDPLGFHLTNTILHALNAGLVGWLALELLGAPAIGFSRSLRRAAAVLAALAWSLHPLRVESVAWVTERKDVLSGLLGLAATVAWVRWARGPDRPFWRSPRFGVALLLYALSLCAKPALVTLPLVLLLLDGYPLRRFQAEGARALILEKLPWLVLAGLATALTLAAHAGISLRLEAPLLTTHALVALHATWSYLALSVWPAALSPFHLHPARLEGLEPEYLLPAAGVLIITAAVLVRARRHPAPAVAWCAYLGLVAPGLGSNQVSATAMADRFSYFPAIPLSILAAAALVALASRLARPRVVPLAALGALAGLAILATLTVRQVGVWRDDVTLWSRPIEVEARPPGRCYFERGRGYALRGDWPSALADLDHAVAIAEAKRYWRLADLYSERARVRARSGDLEGAVEGFTRAIEADVDHAQYQFYGERAAVYRAQGREDLAREDDARAVKPTFQHDH